MKVANITYMLGMSAAAVVILISVIIFVPIEPRVSGVGIMPQEPPAVNSAPSIATPINENQQGPNLPQVNCVKDEWWSPVLAAVVVNQCTPAQASNGQEHGNIPPVTKTIDKEGKTTLSSKDEGKKNKVETELSSSLTAEEESNFERFYLKGYTTTYSDVDRTAFVSHEFTVNAHFNVASDKELACMAGWFNGVSASLEAQDLTKNTLEALGINKIPTDLNAFRELVGSNKQTQQTK